MVNFVLKTKTGLYLNVMKFPGELKLQATEVQNEKNNAPRVGVFHLNTWMAFCFQDGEKHYLLKVEGTKLTLEVYKGQKEQQLSDDYWFQRVDLGTGEHHGLQTVRSHQYLCIQEYEPTVMLTEHKQYCLSVRRMEA